MLMTQPRQRPRCGPWRRSRRTPPGSHGAAMANRSCSSAVCAELWRVWVNGTRPPERVEVVNECAEYPATAAARDRLVFAQFGLDCTPLSLQRRPPSRTGRSVVVVETGPHFSPEGRRLAFGSGRSGDFAIWVAAADGSDARQLTHNPRQWPGSPAWSPDGRSIAFDSATLVVTFTSGPSMRKAARHARSRQDRVLRRSRGGRATAGGFISRATRTVRGISCVCERRVGSRNR